MSDARCDRFRDAISARADEEDGGISDEALEEHLSGCVSCREFSDATHNLRRRLGIYDATAVPDISRNVVANVAREDRRRSSPAIRWLLAVIAVQIIVLAVPDFLAGGSSSHSLRHVGAFSMAYAVGLLGVVVRPARARTMLGVAVVLVAALAATTAVDVFRGNVSLPTETVHLLEVGSAVLLWVLTRPGTGTRKHVAVELAENSLGHPPTLHVVGDDQA